MTRLIPRNSLPLSSFFRTAIVAGVERAIKIHIDRGDDLDACDSSGQTPLMLAAKRNNPSVFKLLLEAGADPYLTDSKGQDALSISHAVGAREITSLLERSFAQKLEGVMSDSVRLQMV